ncbi:hypothetical protein QYF61_021984 [Mycteria americana]|uniref:Rna-directed dna polymerase from mobile element jockey-like n=1 Tax=Mycteria americana TaxID=33587 RepID=A0AAN7NLY9_MYCAM|nr:hypothetical protein QYF61_021984 [Mycteria americana]
MDDGAEHILSKSADDTKLGGGVDMPVGRAAIQRDLDRLEKWANRNLVNFSKGKGKSLYLGRNMRGLYMLRADWQQSSFAEKELGVLVDTKLNISQQCALAENKGKQHPQTVLSLEFCVQVWAPQYKTDMNILARVQ